MDDPTRRGASVTLSRMGADRFERALEGWGGFLDHSGRRYAPGGWMPADGELIRSRFDRHELDLLSVDAPHLVVARTPADVARTKTTRHIVIAQLAGSSILTPADRRAPVVLEPGAVSYGDPAVPYRWEFDGPFRLLMLRMPHAALPVAPGVLRPVVGQPFSSESGYARLAVRFAHDVLNDHTLLPGASGMRIAHDLVGMFATMLIDRLASADAADASEPAFQRALAYISDHLLEPLTLSEIAAGVDMSPRYMQLLFQKRGMSVTGWIRERRLERARRALADPAWASADILQIALAHGFADHSHFTRAFRKEYGETPSGWRRKAA